MDREIEKLKLSEMTCREGVIEVAKMWVLRLFFLISLFSCMYFFLIIIAFNRFSLFPFWVWAFLSISKCACFDNAWQPLAPSSLFFSPSLLNPCWCLWQSLDDVMTCVYLNCWSYSLLHVTKNFFDEKNPCY